jgi:hypothetical protein
MVTLGLHILNSFLLYKITMTMLWQWHRTESPLVHANAAPKKTRRSPTKLVSTPTPTPAAQVQSDEDKRVSLHLGCLFAACVYAVHPLNAEVVLWPSAQSYALSASFALLAVRAYVTCDETTLDPYEPPPPWSSKVLHSAGWYPPPLHTSGLTCLPRFFPSIRPACMSLS